MKTCETCVFWDGKSHQAELSMGYGTCDNDEDHRAPSGYGEEWERGFAVVHKSSGCVAHMDKDA